MNMTNFANFAMRLVLGVSLAILVAMSAGGCGPASGPVEAREPTASAAPKVKVMRLERGTITKVTRQPGQIEAFEEATLHAKVAGYVRELAVDTGDRVTRGQVMAQLAVPELEADLLEREAMLRQAAAEVRVSEAKLKKAQAGVKSAEARQVESVATVSRAEADQKRWEAEFARVEELVNDRAVASSILDVTRKELEAARATLDESKARVQTSESTVAEAVAALAEAEGEVEAAKARVMVAEAEVERARAYVEFATIRAPFDGVVTLRHVDTGDLTVPGGENSPMFDVAMIDRVRVVVGIPEMDAPRVEPGDLADVRLQALDSESFAGTVTRTSWTLDPGTRTMRVEVDLDNEKERLRPGLYAYVDIQAEEHADVWTLPMAALMREASQAWVAVVKEGKIERRDVTPGLNDGTRVEILEGLNEGEMVAAVFAPSLADGLAVEVDADE